MIPYECSQNFCPCCQHQSSDFMGNFPCRPPTNSNQTLLEGPFLFWMMLSLITLPTVKLGLPCPGTNCWGIKLGKAEALPELQLMQTLGCCHRTGGASVLPSSLWCGGRKRSSKEPCWLIPQTKGWREANPLFVTPDCVYNALRGNSADKINGLYLCRSFGRKQSFYQTQAEMELFMAGMGEKALILQSLDLHVIS